MTLFYIILLVLVNLLLLGALIWMWSEKEYWVEKYRDQLQELYPIEWDYTKERGWRTDDDSGR